MFYIKISITVNIIIIYVNVYFQDREQLITGFLVKYLFPYNKIKKKTDTTYTKV